jgi:hypothetical protein
MTAEAVKQQAKKLASLAHFCADASDAEESDRRRTIRAAGASPGVC